MKKKKEQLPAYHVDYLKKTSKEQRLKNASGFHSSNGMYGKWELRR